MLKRVEDIAEGYRHALCQFELSDLLSNLCEIAAVERRTFQVHLLRRQVLVSENWAGKPLDAELFDKRATKEQCVRVEASKKE